MYTCKTTIPLDTCFHWSTILCFFSCQPFFLRVLVKDSINSRKQCKHKIPLIKRRYLPRSLREKKTNKTTFSLIPNASNNTCSLNIAWISKQTKAKTHMRFTKRKEINSLCVWGISFQGHKWTVSLLHRHSFSLNSVNIPKTYYFPLYFAGGGTSKMIAQEWRRGKGY